MLHRGIVVSLTLFATVSLSASAWAQDGEPAQSLPPPSAAASPESHISPIDDPHAKEVSRNAAMAPPENADSQWEDARAIVSRGEALFSNGNYEGALADFFQAYELLANGPRRAAVLYNLALCYERMFRYDEALGYYERYLRDSGPDAEDRATSRATRIALYRGRAVPQSGPRVHGHRRNRMDSLLCSASTGTVWLRF